MHATQAVKQLVRTLREAATLLEQLGDEHWAASLKRNAEDLEQGDVEAIQSFLGSFGGMGSLNDSYTRSYSDKQADDEVSRHERACRRIEEAWKLAKALVNSSR
ncbi:hypothetical protein [Haloferula sp. BvORR071]|uniref:DUF6966 domain-containing protein n=1 Tax=Haloferula sp. BvORR071 TaxID=1396141 RepID=UPI00054DC2C0|nr:hypothetical protein [Haloferula sp. BvORR071]